MAKSPFNDPRLEEGMHFGPGKVIKRPAGPRRSGPQFPEDPRDPWPWISLALSVVALVVAVLSAFRP